MMNIYWSRLRVFCGFWEMLVKILTFSYRSSRSKPLAGLVLVDATTMNEKYVYSLKVIPFEILFEFQFHPG